MKTDVHDEESNTMTMKRPRRAERPEQPNSPEQAEMMKRMEAAGTPGPGHKALNALAGDWKAEVKCWGEPEGAPAVSHGTASASWTLNGRFLEEDFHGEMGGRPFTGRWLLGYDNTKEVFNSVWLSDTQTSIFTSEGKGKNGNRIITLEGKSSCAATGKKDIPMKTVLRIISPERHVLEMYDGSKGDAKTMEITYTRS